MRICESGCAKTIIMRDFLKNLTSYVVKHISEPETEKTGDTNQWRLRREY